MNRLFHTISRKLCEDVTEALDIIPPPLLLAKLFRPYHYIVTTFGILPISIGSDGKAYFKVFSWSSFKSLLALGTFIMDSFLLVPMYLSLVKSSGADQQNVIHVAQMMFLSCQYLGAIIIGIISTWSIPPFILYWEKIQNLVATVSVLTSISARDFCGAYLGAKWNIRIWMTASVSFSVFCVYSYGSGFDHYIGNEVHPLYYWAIYSGFCAFPYILSFHILHSIIFATFCMILRTCFVSLRKYCESIAHDKFGNIPKIYAEINELIEETGKIGGKYVAIEVLIMTICVTMNAFFLVLNLVENSGSLVYLAMIIPYCFWFHWICQLGESLRKEGDKCCKAVKRVSLKDPANQEWFLIENPVHVTAKGYFSIRMQLFTTVMGTISTYLVVLLQFTFGSSPGHKQQHTTLEINSSSEN